MGGFSNNDTLEFLVSFAMHRVLIGEEWSLIFCIFCSAAYSISFDAMIRLLQRFMTDKFGINPKIGEAMV